MKLAPRPPEYRRSRPGCAPVEEPVARTPAIRDGATPSRLIWVAGFTAGVPGAGDTVTAAEAALGHVSATKQISTTRMAVNCLIWRTYSAADSASAVSAGQPKRRLGAAGRVTKPFAPLRDCAAR